MCEPSFKLNGDGTPGPGKEVVLLLLFPAGSLQNLWAHLENGFRTVYSLSSSLLPPKGCQLDESEHRYFGPAIVLTIGMIKQIVYLYYSHRLHPHVQKSFVHRCTQEGDFLQSQKPVVGRKWGHRRGKGAFIFFTGFLFTLNWFLSALVWPGMSAELQAWGRTWVAAWKIGSDVKRDFLVYEIVWVEERAKEESHTTSFPVSERRLAWRHSSACGWDPLPTFPETWEAAVETKHSPAGRFLRENAAPPSHFTGGETKAGPCNKYLPRTSCVPGLFWALGV